MGRGGSDRNLPKAPSIMARVPPVGNASTPSTTTMRQSPSSCAIAVLPSRLSGPAALASGFSGRTGGQRRQVVEPTITPSVIAPV